MSVPVVFERVHSSMIHLSASHFLRSLRYLNFAEISQYRTIESSKGDVSESSSNKIHPVCTSERTFCFLNIFHDPF